MSTHPVKFALLVFLPARLFLNKFGTLNGSSVLGAKALFMDVGSKSAVSTFNLVLLQSILPKSPIPNLASINKSVNTYVINYNSTCNITSSRQESFRVVYLQSFSNQMARNFEFVVKGDCILGTRQHFLF